MFDARFYLAAAAVVAAVAACGGSSSTPPAATASVGSAGANIGAATVKISATDQLKFSPTSVTAHVGDVIEWTNTGTVTHTVTFDSQPSLSDPSLNASGTWEVRFNAAGTYAFHCTIHPGMTGTLTVS